MFLHPFRSIIQSQCLSYPKGINACIPYRDVNCGTKCFIALGWETPACSDIRTATTAEEVNESTNRLSPSQQLQIDDSSFYSCFNERLPVAQIISFYFCP